MILLKATNLWIVLLPSLIALNCCTQKKTESIPSQDTAALQQPRASAITSTPNVTPTPNSPIRKVAFGDFTYAAPTYGYLGRKEGIEYLGRSKHKYRLRDGQEPAIRDKEGLLENIPASLNSTDYVDVTGDGEEEALIVLGIQTGGSAIPNELYVYAWDKNKVKPIFSFSTGDRADGGFRKIYGEGGELIIELNAGDEKAPDCDGCQSTRFSRNRYKWNGRKFVKVSQEILPVK
jgi:hypothetical protein